jgi:tripartite-type tricarboxylate transporter receptor subunit TctC
MTDKQSIAARRRRRERMPSTSCTRILSLAAIAAAMAVGPAYADPVTDFYKGKTITLIVSSAPGGGYDALSRVIAPHLGRHIPGNPQVVVKNMSGAGGIVATKYLFNVAPRDGTFIGGVQNNTPFEPLFGTKEATYDPLKFGWLGTPSFETALLTVWHTTPVNTWQDVLKHEITVGSSGVHSTPSFYGRLLKDILGLKLRIVVGYESQSKVFLAMERGEVDGYPSVFYSALTSTRPTWVPQKLVKLLVQIGVDKEPALPDVPSLLDLAKTPDDKTLVLAAAGPLAAGRPYLMPPGVPADRATALQKAMTDMFKDPAFLADAEKRHLDVKAPRSGAQLHDLLERIYTKTPPQVIERLRKISTP